jgi:protein-tyrosine kinase
MTIQEALERAKRLAREKALQKEDVGVDAAVPSKAGPREASRRQGDRTQAQPVKLAFDRLDYDAASCELNHILVPGDATGSLNAAALDSYAMVRARMAQKMKANNWWKVGITSPGPGEGKSVTALNLALSVARERNANVFLMDLDLRNPSLCRYLGVKPKFEIAQFLIGSIPIERLFFSIGVDNLAMAGSLSPTSNSSELLASGRVDRLMDSIRVIDPSCVVIVDLPPVLHAADALVVADSVDAIMMVASVGVTRRDGLTNALEVLSAHTLAGLVLNRSDELVTDYYGSARRPYNATA